MRGGMSEESYLTFMDQGRSAPCNGCAHENYCKLGYTCEMYRKWEMIRSSAWKKDKKSYTQIPDRPI